MFALLTVFLLDLPCHYPERKNGISKKEKLIDLLITGRILKNRFNNTIKSAKLSEIQSD